MNTKQWKFNKEVIEPERWVWGVIYKDNSELHQFGNDLIFHQIKEIKWAEVKMFTMYKMDDMKKRIDMVVMPDMQVFHFYRNIRPAGVDHFIKVYVFGYKIRETSKACYNFILPDDRMIIADQDNIDLTKFEIGR